MDKPILFSAEMIRALLDGRKTQTRRVVKPQPPIQPPENCHPKHEKKHSAPYLDAYCGEHKTQSNPRGMSADWCWWQVDNRQCLPTFRCPYGQPGDLLWVRETWCQQFGSLTLKPLEPRCAFYRATEKQHIVKSDDDCHVSLNADGTEASPWIPSIFMPRWASRLTLTLTEVRVQRLQEISEDDAISEGIERVGGPTSCSPWKDYSREQRFKFFSAPSASYRTLWDSINAKRAPWESNPWVWALTFTVHQSNIDTMDRERFAA